MKKILFIARSLECGGISKSLLNLLNTIDLESYDIHLFIMSKEIVEYESFLPVGITIHKNKYCSWLLSKYYASAESVKSSIQSNARLRRFSPKRLLTKVNKAYAAWIIAMLCPALKGEYDTIVDFYGQSQLYYMVEKLKGKKKITFFHNDYSQFDTYKDMDKYYFPRVDHIYTISPTCVQSIQRMFPKVANMVSLMENITSPKVIKQLANEDIDIPVHKGLLFVTVGHVCLRKGSDFVIDAAEILKKRGYDFLWILVGTKGDAIFEETILNKRLQDRVILQGSTLNPYPFIKKADIIVHPSRFEGKTIVLDEAKILAKPIVATNFTTVKDQLENGVNASICEMNADALADTIEELIVNEVKRKAYIDYLTAHEVDNSSEIEKLYSIFDQ